MNDTMIIAVKTPQWALGRLPAGTVLLRIDGADGLRKWFLLIWNQQHAIMSPNPDVWMPLQDGALSEDVPMETWYPPMPHVADLIRKAAQQAYTEKTPAQMGIQNLLRGQPPTVPNVELAWGGMQPSAAPVQPQNVQPQKVFDMVPPSKQRAPRKKSNRRRKKK